MQIASRRKNIQPLKTQFVTKQECYVLTQNIFSTDAKYTTL